MQFKKGKKTLALVLAIMMSLSITGGVYAAGDAEALPINTYPFPEEVAAVLAAEKPLIETYNEMMDSFRTRDGDIVYPDTYGGAYIEDGDLHINITDISAASTLISNAKTDRIVYHLTPYSLAELETLMNLVTDIDFSDVVSVGVRQKFGKVYIGVNEKIKDSQSLSSCGDSDGYLAEIQIQLEKELAEVISNSTDKVVFDTNNLPVHVYWEREFTPSVITLQGGMTMTRVATNTIRSLGICGYINAPSTRYSVVLTCGHNTNIDDIFTISGTTLGQAYFVSCAANQYFDYSIIRIINPSAFTPTSRVLTSSSYTTITNLATSDAVEGSTVCKYGWNGFATGVVQATNTSSLYPQGRIFGLTLVKINNSFIGNCSGGDSGGSVYAGTTFYGLYASDNRVTDDNDVVIDEATYFYFSPIRGVPDFTLS